MQSTIGIGQPAIDLPQLVAGWSMAGHLRSSLVVAALDTTAT
jgi:hypothetical protein